MAVKFSEFDVASVIGDIDYLVGYKSSDNVQITPALINSQNTLNSVTNNGATTTNSLTAASFIKSGGTSSQFLKADGSSDDLSSGIKVNLIRGIGNDYDDQYIDIMDESINFGVGNLDRLSINASGINVMSTGSVKLPNGSTAQRPTAAAGMLRFNTTDGRFEGYNGTEWVSIGAVTSFNSRTGAITFLGSDIPDDSIAYAKLADEFTTSANIAASNIDFSSAAVFTKTLTAATDFTYAGTQVGMVKDLVINANGNTFTLPTGTKIIAGTPTTGINFIQVVVTAAGEYWTSISQQQS